MPKTNVSVNVNFNNDPPTCNPDPVPVSKASNSGIQWNANLSGYTFTGVQIDGANAPTGDFGTPQISTVGSGNNARSQMTVSDSGDANPTDYTYTLLYTTPSGEARTYDPTIENRD